jgi:hypothetical protein
LRGGIYVLDIQNGSTMPASEDVKTPAARIAWQVKIWVFPLSVHVSALIGHHPNSLAVRDLHPFPRTARIPNDHTGLHNLNRHAISNRGQAARLGRNKGVFLERSSAHLDQYS